MVHRCPATENMAGTASFLIFPFLIREDDEKAAALLATLIGHDDLPALARLVKGRTVVAGKKDRRVYSPRR